MVQWFTVEGGVFVGIRIMSPGIKPLSEKIHVKMLLTI